MDMISLADSKANMSISIQSLLITIGLGSSLLADTFEKLQELDNSKIPCIFYLLVGVLIISSCLGIILAVHVYKARTHLKNTNKKRKSLLYFGHIVQFPSLDDYRSKIRNIDEKGILNEYIRQVYILSDIANEKMKYVNKSSYFLIFNLILTIILITFSGFISTL